MTVDSYTRMFITGAALSFGWFLKTFSRGSLITTAICLLSAYVTDRLRRAALENKVRFGSDALHYCIFTGIDTVEGDVPDRAALHAMSEAASRTGFSFGVKCRISLRAGVHIYEPFYGTLNFKYNDGKVDATVKLPHNSNGVACVFVQVMDIAEMLELFARYHNNGGG